MRSRRRRDDGNITIVVLFMTLAIFMVCALVFDAGNALTSRQKAADTADQAARAGADAVLPTTGGVVEPKLDPARAEAAALDYLSSVGLTGTVEASSDQVTVTVVIDHPTRLLSALGITTLTVRATSTARPIPGIQVPVPGSGG